MSRKFKVPKHGEAHAEGGSWIRATGEDLPETVLVRLGVGEDGKIVATGLLIEAKNARELTTRAARIPVAQLVGEFVAATANTRTYKRLARELHDREQSAEEDAWQDTQGIGRAREFVEVLAPVDGDLAGWSGQHELVTRARPGRRGWPDDHWRAVAQAYRQAEKDYPGEEVKAVRRMLGADSHPVPEATVHRWLRTAEDRDFLKKRPGRR